MKGLETAVLVHIVSQFLVKPGCQTGHAYPRTERIIQVQTQMMSQIGTPARTK